MSHPFRTTFLMCALIVPLTSCSWSQVFRLSVTVVDKNDGKAIPGAKVLVDTYLTNEEEKNNPIPPGTGLLTDEAGRREYEFSISGYTPTASGGNRWYLKVNKEGYEPVIIDFKPNPPPERSRDKPIPLTIRVELQPVKDSPR